MIPKPPPREGQIGFLYFPPYRIQGTSVAGEATTIMVPELDVCFDMGSPLRCALASKYVALTHGHMDHIGGLAYYASQRQFQGMGEGTIVCDKRIAPDVHKMMRGFNDLERQKTPYTLIELEEGEELQIKNNIVLRGFAVEHTAPAFGWTLVEKRSKLKPELVGLPQEKLRELKERGQEITNQLEVPLIAYTGDTLPGPHLVRDDVRKAQIVVSECTFFEPEHKSRAKVGMHLHVDDIAEWSRILECEALVLVHVSRRTNISYARKRLDDLLSGELRQRVHLLMDHRASKERYDKQAEHAGSGD